MYMEHPYPMCCLPHIRLNAKFLRVCKQLTLQFVILKPICGAISFILIFVSDDTLNVYNNSVWQGIQLTLYNISYTLALYGNYTVCSFIF